MSEEKTTSDAYAPTPPAESGDQNRATKKRRRPLRSAIIVLLVGAGVIAALQLSAPSTDHQYANMFTLGAGLLTAIFVLLQLHRFCVDLGYRLAMPGLMLLAIGGLVAAFEFDGFSGEMVPQFKLRFGGKPRLQAKSVVEKSGQSPEAVADRDASTAAEPSTGFLASQRTGVIAKRSFEVPKKDNELQTLWDQGIGEGWSSFAVSGDKAVTLEQRDADEWVACYRLADGKLLWFRTHEARHQHALGGIGPRSTPTIDNGRVYAQGATGRVWCLDLETGEEVWSVDLLELAGWNQVASETLVMWGRAGSPLLVDSAKGRLCIVPYGGPEINSTTGRSLIALDAKSGKVQWTAGDDQISFASPTLMTLAAVLQIVSVNERTVSGHAIDDGKQLWSIDWPGNSNGDANCATAIPAGNDRFLVGKGYGGGSALIEVTSDGTSMTANDVWLSSRVLKTKFTHACVDGDVAYAVSNGSLEAVRIEDGEKLWTQPRSLRFQQGQILLVDDVIVAQAEGGDVVMVAADPGEYRELMRIPAMTSKTWNVPTVAGRHLLVRNDRQAICFLLPARD